MPAQRARLVGRADEVALVIEAARAARAGRPSVVIVSGEAGIGKTRLVEEVTERALTEGFLVAAGQCSPVSGTRLPYGPVVDLVSDLLRQHPDLPGEVPVEVWRGVAPLTGVEEQAPAAPDLNLASTRLVAGFVEVLSAVSRQRPALLVVEDVHWADPASVDLIAFVARKLRDDRIVLLLTNRPAGARSRSPVRSALGELKRLDSTTDIRLDPLPDSALEELLLELPVPPEPPVRSRIAALAEGIPFFALHLALHDDGRAVPPRIRDVLLSSLDDLSDEERALLILLTVMGDVNDEQLLLKAAHTSLDEFNQLARALVDRGLIVVRDGSIGFRHALLREVVVDDTLPSERVVAHSRVADSLMASAAEHQQHRAAQLAHHLLECGRHDEAIDYAIRGARHASNVWAFADARNLFTAARRLWPLVDAPEAAAGVGYPELLREAAMASRWCGDLDGALALLHEALNLADVPPGVRAEIEHAHGQVLWAVGDMGASLAAYRRAEELLPASSNDRLRSAVLAALAQGLMATGHARQAEKTAHAAADLASAAGADRARIHASITAAVARAQQGDVDSGVAGLRSCLPEARRLDDLELVVRCYGNLTYALGIACRYEELASAAAEGEEVCRRYGPVVSLASTLMNNQVNALVALGRWDEAVQVARSALQDMTASSVALHLRIALGELAVARGDTAEADQQLAEAQLLGAGNPYALSALSVVSAERALWEHDPQAASASIVQALPDLRAQDDALPLLEACWLGLRAAADVAERAIPLRRSGAGTPENDELLDIASDALERTSLPVAAAILLASKAEAERIAGSDTVEQWTAAADANAELSRPYFRAYCLMRLGAVQLRRQARSAAAQVLGEALRTAENLGARPLTAEIRTLIAVSDLRLDPPSAAPPNKSRPRTGPYGLTARERQVLALITTGATNRAVARALFISERTASVHVSNILTKLGAANRTEAARLAVRLNLDIDPPQ
jgi:DNA-binding CsgD family transcriptional regulator